MGRHRLLWIGILAMLCWCLGSGTGWAIPSASTMTDADIVHVLNRLGFGPRPGDIEYVRDLGIEAYLQAQLSPAEQPESPTLTQRLQQFKTLRLSPGQLQLQYSTRGIAKLKSAPARKAAQLRSQTPQQEITEARLLRALLSQHQLEEVMVNFWFNHFNIEAVGDNRFWVGAYERDAIRPYVLGSFRDLLGATAHHPSMLLYLDNWRNTAPQSPKAQGAFKGLNENYARELLELHTMGVDGGYTQADVVAAARVFTGWGLPHRWRQPEVLATMGNHSSFYFDPDRHDFSDKTFLQTTIAGQGMAEGEQVLDILAQHPATAHHISYKLAQYFVADDPPQRLVNQMAEQFQRTDGDIRAVLETLLHSEAFWQARAQKFRTPYEYILASLRASNSTHLNARRVSGMMTQLSMPLYGCSSPKGYANTQTAWLNPDALTRRISMARQLAHRQEQGPVDAQQLAATLKTTLSEHSRSVIETAPPRLRATLMLGSPEMMYR